MNPKDKRSRWITVSCVAVVAVLILSLLLWRSGVFAPSEDQPTQPTTVPTQEAPPSDTQEPSSWPTEGEDPYADPKQPPAEVQLSCDYAAAFSGSFVEDASDKSVKNVASILITNKSDRFLEYARLDYEIDGKPAVFEVSALPPGRGAWVMESNAMTVTDDSELVYIDAMTVFIDDVVSNPEELTIQYGANMLRVINKSAQTLENVTVYYKVVHKDGNFFGGIAYRVNFGTLAPGEASEKIAGHYKEDWTSIIRVTWQESAGDETS